MVNSRAMPLGEYDALTRAYVFCTTYPGVYEYRGVGLASNMVGKAIGAVVRAVHSVERAHNELVGLAFEDLGQFNEHKRDLARARDVWELIVSRFDSVGVGTLPLRLVGSGPATSARS